MFQRNRLTTETNSSETTNKTICCEEHREQLRKFKDLSKLLPIINMNNLALHFAQNCSNNKKAARAARRQVVFNQRSTVSDEKGVSPFHIVDQLLAAPDGIYNVELSTRSFQEFCSQQDLKSAFQRYIRALTLEDYSIIPYAFDVQFKFRSLSFLTREQRASRLQSMRQSYLRETKINRVHKNFTIHFRTIVDPFVTPRSIQTIVEDKNGHAIRLSIYNWHQVLVDQSIEQIQNRVRRGKSFLIGNPFVKMAADNLLLLRVDNPLLEMFFIDYEKEIDHFDADRLRDIGNKCFRNNDVYGAIEYYSLGLKKSPQDTRILSNRAECYLQGQLAHAALADCQRILEINQTQSNDDNSDATMMWKVYYRRMRALIGLQMYDEAKSSIDPLLPGRDDLTSTHNEIVERFRRIIDVDIPRLQTEANGQYKMTEFLNDQNKRTDEFSAEFELPNAFEFRLCSKEPNKGFGLFALRSLTPGTLLLVERPFAFAHLKTNEDLVNDRLHVMHFAIGRKRDSRINAEGTVSTGKYFRQTSLELLRILETRILVDPKYSMEKLSHLMPLRQQIQRQNLDDEENFQLLPYKLILELYERNVIGTGLWPKFSRFNHSCLPNCSFLVINHLCFVNVLKPIEIGEELTISYLPSVYNSYLERTLRLRDYYIDQCDCSLCQYDRIEGQSEMQQLCRLFEENDDDENKRRFIFKHLISQYGQSRPLGFVEQMSLLKRSVSPEIFVSQVRHGYLAHPSILNYLLTHLHKYSKLKSVFRQLESQFGYFQWNITNDDIPEDEQKRQWADAIELFIKTLPN